MLKPGDRRIQVLLVSHDPAFVERWMDLCACHHCSAFHVTPRQDGLFRNLSKIDFDIAVLSLDTPTEVGSAVDYLEGVSPDCIVIPCSPSDTILEQMGGHARRRSYLIAPSPSPSGDEDALVMALRQVCQKKAFDCHAAA
ncbi:MAG: hypothetical protein LAO31_02760 [Acidobacteriia bacterium]|nr:hypothetical protein [Terriglobia bacterium]